MLYFSHSENVFLRYNILPTYFYNQATTKKTMNKIKHKKNKTQTK